MLIFLLFVVVAAHGGVSCGLCLSNLKLGLLRTEDNMSYQCSKLTCIQSGALVSTTANSLTRSRTARRIYAVAKLPVFHTDCDGRDLSYY